MNAHHIWQGVLTAIGAATLTASVIAPTAQAMPDDNPPQYRQNWLQQDCAQEDSNNCFWNAEDKGNGEGHSFYAIPLHRGRVCIVYWDPAFNRRHGYCEDTHRP